MVRVRVELTTLWLIGQCHLLLVTLWKDRKLHLTHLHQWKVKTNGCVKSQYSITLKLFTGQDGNGLQLGKLTTDVTSTL